MSTHERAASAPRSRANDIGRWLRSPTGLLAAASAALLTGGVAIPQAAYLSAIGALGLLVVLARVASHSTRRTNETRAELRAARSSIQALEAAVATITKRLTDAEGRLAAVANRVESERSERSRLDEVIVERIRVTEKRTKTLHDASASQERRLEAQRGQVDRLASSLSSLRLTNRRAHRDESSVRSLAIAHNRSEPELRRVLLLLTIHRSGSTRMFDMLRTHPGVRVAATSEVWDRLGLTGRRYPAAFSDTSDGREAIEVAHGHGVLIPKVHQANIAWTHDQWAVEKTHPQFHDFDVAALVERATTMRSDGIELLMVHQIRRPLDAMWSMIEFKRRQPEWYEWLDPDEVPEWIRRSLQSIADTQELLPGLVVDFDDLPRGDALHRLGRALAPDWTPQEVTDWLDHAAEATDRSKRTQVEGAGFIGEPDPERSPLGPDGAWAGLDDVLSEAERLYGLIRSRA